MSSDGLEVMPLAIVAVVVAYVASAAHTIPGPGTPRPTEAAAAPAGPA
jgi:hypothetical protein